MKRILNKYEPTQGAPYLFMKRLATLLVALMAGLFIITFYLPTGAPAAPWLRAFAEAAMIGALADWFAVVALFRHPMGLPFPHTGVIPKNKDRLAEGLGEFVQSNFLSGTVIRAKLQSLSLANTASRWLSEPSHSSEVTSILITIFRSFLNALDEEKVSGIVKQLARDLVLDVPLAKTAGQIIKSVLDEDKPEGLLHQLLRFADYFLNEHSVFLANMLGKQMPWYVPWFVHDAVYQKIVYRLKQQIAGIVADPLHPAREIIREEVLKIASDWMSSDAAAKKGEELKQLLFRNEALADALLKSGARVKKSLSSALDNPTSHIRLLIDSAVRNLASAIVDDSSMSKDLDKFLTEMLVTLVSSHPQEIRSLITDTIVNWDATTLTNKIEQEVGRDLQYIRINGTIVGGFLGLIIYAIAQALGG